MNQNAVQEYRCPYTAEPLTLCHAALDGDEVATGVLRSSSGREYSIIDGIPHLISPADDLYSTEQQKEYTYYESSSGEYDAGMNWLFKSFKEDEPALRRRMVELLELTPTSRVLETGSGTCRDSVHIEERLGPEGTLFLQDLSARMLTVGRKRLTSQSSLHRFHCRKNFFVGNACHLPLADGCLDAAFHFGGLNVFADKKRAILEMARVVRPGGKVVIGDEGVAPWLRGTTHGDILINSNPLYQHSVPLDCLPVNAQDVCVRWLLGNAFYMIDFRVGIGPPALDLDLPIPGRRGGTHRTRYFGRLDGVTPETKEMALQAAAAAGLSVHDWLERVVRTQADNDRIPKE